MIKVLSIQICCLELNNSWQKCLSRYALCWLYTTRPLDGVTVDG